MFQIETGYEIPGVVRESKYPFQHMDVGDSFLHPFDLTEEGETNAAGTVVKVRAAVNNYRKRDDTKKFVVRIVEDGVRCWRSV
jgi:hypothetical protein